MSRKPHPSVVLGSASLLVAVLLHTAAAVQHSIPYETLSRDLFQVAGAPVYVGLLSNIGVALWLVGATVAILAAVAMRGCSVSSAPLWGAGLLSGWLCLDDFLMIHEITGRRLGISTSAVVVLEAVAAVYWAIRHRDWIRRADWCWLVAAVAAWSLSLGFDFAHDELAGVLALLGSWSYYAEDMPKLVGIVAWTWFLGSASLQALRAELVKAPPTDTAATGSG